MPGKSFSESTVALVTGASRGIGRACALELAAMGCDVIVHYNSNNESAERVADEIRAMGQRAEIAHADVTDERQVRQLFLDLRSSWGRLDVFVANSGIVADGYLAAMSIDKWQRVIATNLTGTFLTCREVVKLMHRTGGSIVIISSIGGITGQPGNLNYCASKGGLIAFAKGLAREVVDRGIRVNTVAPGFTDTDMLRAMDAKSRAKYLAMVPMGRAGSPEEIAAAVGFLAGPSASYITGKVLAVDGGMVF